MSDWLITPIEYLKGVGPQRADLLKKELRIYQFEHLLYHFPFRYVDRSVHHKVKELLELEGFAQLKGRIIDISETGTKQKRLTVKFQDETGMIDLVWFQGAKWMKSQLHIGKEYQVFGKVKIYGNKWNIPHPEIVAIEDIKINKGLQSVYNSTEKLVSKGLHTRGLETLCLNLLNQINGNIYETLPPYILKRKNLMPLAEALKNIHFPESQIQLERAQYRLKFEELFYLQLELLLRKELSLKRTKGIKINKVGKYFNEFYEHHLPFQLTNAQKKVIKEIHQDFLSGKHMNRLLQGDVGSGKTLVALMSMLLMIGNGYQTAIIAPTEILANQHFVGFTELLEPLGIKVDILTGSVSKKRRELIHENLRNGNTHILVGTHALLEDVVQFSNLGYVVIDEQHRFGVAQRAKMWKKNTKPPHILIMTATPIPRTLAMTFYGDLEVSVIDELPPGRKAINTFHKTESARLSVLGFIREQISFGRQIYIVYPLIRESETLDYMNLMEGFEAISRTFPLPEFKVSIVHGQMKAKDKDFEMQRFVRGETQIMVATTVIEVGVNVPNASVMLIESSERFGLSQLHQLRGRVGRGAEKSYCILMSGNKLSKESKKRIQTMVRTQDGFEIAEVDMEIRGPGDILGTQQSGMLDLKIADLSRDAEIVTEARNLAKKILGSTPELEGVENEILRIQLKKKLKNKPNWSKIS